MAQTFSPDPAFDKVDYTGPSVTGSDLQKLCLFRADDTRYARPANGRPTIVYISMGGFRFSHLVRVIGPKHTYNNATTPDTDGSYVAHRFLFDALMRGWNVVTACVTPAFGGAVQNGTTAYQHAGAAVVAFGAVSSSLRQTMLTSLTNGADYTVSVYAKVMDGGGQATVNLSISGSAASAETVADDGAWHRIDATIAAPAAATDYYDIACTSRTIALTWAQVESGAVLTAYEGTTAAVGTTNLLYSSARLEYYDSTGGSIRPGWVPTGTNVPTISAGTEDPDGYAGADIDYVLGQTMYEYGAAPDGNGICIPYHGGAFPTAYKDADGVTEALGAVHPFQDVRRHNCFMDSEMIAQFIHANAEAMGIDLNMVYGMGDSAGADVSAWCAFHTNRAPERWLNPSGQELLSTDIYAGGFYKTWQPSFNMVGAGYNSPAGTCRVPKTGSHVLDRHFDVPGDDIANVSRDDIKQGDLMEFYTAEGIVDKFMVTYFNEDDTYNSGLGAGAGPWDTEVEAAVTTNPHDGYGLGLIKTLLGNNCQAYKLDGMTCDVAGSVAFDSTVSGYDLLHFRFLNFLEANAGMSRVWSFNPHLRRILRTK